MEDLAEKLSLPGLIVVIVGLTWWAMRDYKDPPADPPDRPARPERRPRP